jgi:hypothetical protein
MALKLGITTSPLSQRTSGDSPKTRGTLASLGFLCHHEKSMRGLESEVEAEMVRRLARISGQW